MFASTGKIAVAALFVLASVGAAAAGDKAGLVREMLHQQIEAAKTKSADASTTAATPIEFTVKVTSNVTIKTPNLSLSKVNCHVFVFGVGSGDDAVTNTASVSAGAATCVATMKIRATPSLVNSMFVTLTIEGESTTQYRLHDETVVSGASAPANGATLAYTRWITF